MTTSEGRRRAPIVGRVRETGRPRRERDARCARCLALGGRVSVNERRGRDEVRCALESVPIDYSCNQQID